MVSWVLKVCNVCVYSTVLYIIRMCRGEMLKQEQYIHKSYAYAYIIKQQADDNSPASTMQIVVIGEGQSRSLSGTDVVKMVHVKHSVSSGIWS